MLTPLCELAKKYVTDKCVPNAYTPVYWELFKDRIESTRTVFEIGIGKNKGNIRWHAASLKMWVEFFPNAMVTGADIRRDLFITEARIRSVYADQGNRESVAMAAASVNDFIDIGIDDGSHDPQHQINSAIVVVPFIRPGGIYIIEDIHHEIVFTEIRRRYEIERIGTNEPIGAVLGIIRC